MGMGTQNKLRLTGRLAPRNRRGLTLIETASALAVTALVLAGFTQMVSTTNEQVRARGTADRLKEITRAAENYLNTYSVALLADPTIVGGGQLVIPVGRTSATGNVPNGPTASLPSLQGSGLLFSDFVDYNPFLQTHVFVVKKNPTAATPTVEGMVISTGGNQIPDRISGTVAALTGATGGYMMLTPPASIGNNIIGARGGWQATPANWTGGGAVTPSPGHVMSVVGLNAQSIAGPYLARLDVGDPEQNTMRIDMSMGGGLINGVAQPYNAVTNAQEICAGAKSGVSCNNDGSVQQIGPNIALPGKETVGGDSNIGGNSNVAGNVTAIGTVNGQTLESVQDILAGRNINAPTGNVSALAFYDAANNSYYLQPSQSSYLNDVQMQTANVAHTAKIFDLQATQIDLDATVYTGANLSSGRTLNNQYRLGDLLPKYVLQEGWSPNNGPSGDFRLVPMPICGSGGQPKILLHPKADSFDFPTTLVLNETSSPLIGQYVQSATPYDEQVTREYSATVQGAFWQVNLTGSNEMPTYQWYAIAMTYCYYP